jgi:hypothetical protein
MLSQSQAYIADHHRPHTVAGATKKSSTAVFAPIFNSTDVFQTNHDTGSMGVDNAQSNQKGIGRSDSSNSSNKLSIELSRFQGLAIGMAYVVGVPIGSLISAKYSIRRPLQLSIVVCALNCLLIALLLPRSTGLASPADASPHTKSPPPASVNWRLANPIGAALMMTRTRKLLLGSMVYFLLNTAHAGVQVTWINFLQYKFGLSQTMSGCTLLAVGVIVALLPPLVM